MQIYQGGCNRDAFVRGVDLSAEAFFCADFLMHDSLSALRCR